MLDTTQGFTHFVQEPLIIMNEAREIQTQDRSKRILSYLKSNDAKELLFYVVFLAVPYLVMRLLLHTPYDRPIPYQNLQDGGNDYIRNLTYNLKEDGETCPTWALIIICAISFLIQLVLSVRVGNVGDVHATICVYIIAMCLTGCLTDGMKHYCGYLRPIFYEECEPNFETGVCAKDSAYVRKSFPSGHASLSFCFMTLLTCYLVQRYGVTSRMTPYSSIISDGDKKEFMIQYKVRQPTYLQRIISLVSFIPMVLAFFVAGSRVHDNHHHPADIVGGAVLGTGISVYFHQVWFPYLMEMSDTDETIV